MAKSKGQDGGRGHSKGPFGHGGHHPIASSSPGIPSHKTDHMRSMHGRSDQTMNGPMPQAGGLGAVQDGMGM